MRRSFQAHLSVTMFGLEIERKTDILALTAFIISMLTATYQVGLFLKGPNAKVLSPEDVVILQHELSENQVFVAIVAPISVVNTSDAQEPLLVKRMTATIDVGDRSISLAWFDSVEAPVTSAGIKLDKTQGIYPFAVDTKKISSQRVRFTPERRRCSTGPACDVGAAFVSIDTFDALMSKSLYDGRKTFTARFDISFENHSAVSTTCNIRLYPDQIMRLHKNSFFVGQCEEGS
jgi:hypothetical protein